MMHEEFVIPVSVSIGYYPHREAVGTPYDWAAANGRESDMYFKTADEAKLDALKFFGEG